MFELDVIPVSYRGDYASKLQNFGDKLDVIFTTLGDTGDSFDFMLIKDFI